MKLSMTVEADAVTMQALNMGRIAVDIDGIELADLIDVCGDVITVIRFALLTNREAGCGRSTPVCRPAERHSVQYRPYLKLTTTCCSLFRISMKTLAKANGLRTGAPAICCVWMRGVVSGITA
jgi:hypothetical protein